MALTPKQERFAQEYPLDFNGAAAYRRAGYKPKSDEAAKVAASRLLTNVNVQEAIAAVLAQRAQSAELSAEKVLQEYQNVAFADLGQLLERNANGVRVRPIQEWPEAISPYLSSIKVVQAIRGNEPMEIIELELHSNLNPKLKAMDFLAGYLGLKKELDPLEVLLGRLPRPLADALRRTLAETLSAERNP